MSETTGQIQTGAAAASDTSAQISGKQVARVIDMTGVTSTTKLLVFAGCLGYLFDAFDNYILGFVMPLVTRDFNFSPVMKGFILSSALWGGVIGMWLWGIVAEQKGRRFAFQGTLLMYTLFCGLTAFVQSPLQMTFTRIITGMGLAGFMPVDLTIVSEMTPTKVRGKLTGSTSLMFPVGTLVAAVTALLLSQKLGWRGMFLLGILPAFVAYIIRRCVPESPRWLASKGRFGEAEDALLKIGASRENIAEARKTIPFESASDPDDVKAKYRELFSRKWLTRNVVAWMLWIAPNSVNLAVNLWLPSYLMMIYHFSLKKSLAYTVANIAVGVIGRTLGVLLVDKLGRKPIIISTLTVGALSLIAASFVTTPEQLIYCIGIYTFFVDAGIVVAVTFVPELFPTRIRAIGSSVAASSSRFTGAMAPILIGVLVGMQLHRFVWIVFAIALALCVVVTAVFAPETKGRTLEELDMKDAATS
jgi:putative MFS transporter